MSERAEKTDTPSTASSEARTPPRRTPHDALHKDLFSHRALLLSFLRAFVRLPFVGRLKAESLRLLSGEFVDEDLRRSQNDMLWQGELEGESRPCYVMILLEFQRTSEPLMAFRILRYMVRVLARWQRDREEAHRRMNEERRRRGLPPLPLRWAPFPLFFPMVIYNGTGEWTAELNMNRLFGVVPEEFLRLLPSLEYVVFNVRSLAWNEPEAAAELAAQWVRFIQARGRVEGLTALTALKRVLRSPGYRDLTELDKSMFRWCRFSLREAGAPWRWLRRFWNEPLPEGVDMGTLINGWEMDGFREGEAKGRAEGRAEGFLNALVSLVHDGLLRVGDAAKKAGMTEDEFRARMREQDATPRQ